MSSFFIFFLSQFVKTTERDRAIHISLCCMSYCNQQDHLHEHVTCGFHPTMYRGQYCIGLITQKAVVAASELTSSRAALTRRISPVIAV